MNERPVAWFLPKTGRVSLAPLALLVAVVLAMAPMGVAFADSVLSAGSSHATVQGGNLGIAADEDAGETLVIDLEKCTIDPIGDEAYDDGDEITPDFTLRYYDAAAKKSYEYKMGFEFETYNIDIAYSNNINVGAATITLKADPEGDSPDVFFTGEKSATFKIHQAESQMVVTPVGNNPSTVYYKTAKQAIKNPLDVVDAAGKVSYQKVSGDSRFTVDGATGEITVAPKTPVGTYALTVRVTDAGDSNYTPGTATKTVKVKVRKANGSLSVKAKKAVQKAKLGKTTKFTTAQLFKVTNPWGAKVTFKKTSGNSKIVVSSAGKVTVKKGLKRNAVYPVKVKATVKGTSNYRGATAKVAFKVKVVK